MNVLRQSATATINLGPFVDDTDGKTAETALTIAQADVRVAKAGGAFAAKSDPYPAPHGENGYYAARLNAADTSTPGPLRIAVSESGALPVFRDFEVIEASVYDRDHRPVRGSTSNNPAKRFCDGVDECVIGAGDSYFRGSADAAFVEEAIFAGGAGDWFRCKGQIEIFGFVHPFAEQAAWGGSPAVTSVAAGAAFPGNATLINQFPHAVDAFSFSSNLADFTALKTWNPVLPGHITSDPASLLRQLTAVGSTIASAEMGYIVHNTPDGLATIQHTLVNAAFGTASPSTYSTVSSSVAEYQAQKWNRTTSFGGAGATGFFPQIVTGDETGRKFFPIGAS
ncbi:MAG: hypothetical protein ACRDD1_06850, partial [Planctomycetia bacterium]